MLACLKRKDDKSCEGRSNKDANLDEKILISCFSSSECLRIRLACPIRLQLFIKITDLHSRILKAIDSITLSKV